MTKQDRNICINDLCGHCVVTIAKFNYISKIVIIISMASWLSPPTLCIPKKILSEDEIYYIHAGSII